VPRVHRVGRLSAGSHDPVSARLFVFRCWGGRFGGAHRLQRSV